MLAQHESTVLGCIGKLAKHEPGIDSQGKPASSIPLWLWLQVPISVLAPTFPVTECKVEV